MIYQPSRNGQPNAERSIVPPATGPASDHMRIGVDLGHTVYGFPEFFREFIPAMAARGHTIVCTSNIPRRLWPQHAAKLKRLGIDPSLFDTSLLWSGETDAGPDYKRETADRCDVVFDNDADLFQRLTRTPAFKVPKEKAADAR